MKYAQRVSFGYMGFAVLVGYQMLLTEFPSLNAAFGQSFGDFMIFSYSFAFNAALFINILVGKRFTEMRRVLTAAIFAAAAVSLLPLTASLIGSSKAGFWLALIETFCYAMGTAIFQGATQGIASRLKDEINMSWFAVGHSLSGLLGMPIKVLLELCGLRSSSTYYVTIEIGALLTLISALVFFYNINGLTKEHDDIKTHVRSMSTAASLKDDESVGISCLKKSDDHSKKDIYDHSVSHLNKTQVIKKTFPAAFNVWLCCFITFALFPNEAYQWNEYTTYMIFTFQVSDFIGRLIGGYTVPFVANNERGDTFGIPKRIYILSSLRLLFVLFFLASSFEVTAFKNVVIRFILMGTLGMSFGLIVTYCMILGPASVAGEKDKVTAGYIMAFALMNGILSGSVAGLALRAIPR